MFRVEKKVLASFDKLYAIAGVEREGCVDTCFAASEGRDGLCVEVDVKRESEKTIWKEPGGTMTLCPRKNGEELFVTRKFWPVFDAGDCEFVYMRRTEKGIFEEIFVQKIPYLHRFEILELPWGKVLLASTLCEKKEAKDDWSHPGAVYAGLIEKEGEPIRLHPILQGLTKNHGFCITEFGGKRAALVSAMEGVFVLMPPDYAEGKWSSIQLLNREISDAVLYDLDGDGREELAVIEGFHGNCVSVSKQGANGWEKVWETSIAFGHALWAGKIKDRNCLLVGDRREKQELCLYDFTDGFINPAKQVIGNGGPSQICVFPGQTGAQILSADREKGEAVLYILKEEER